ncbi:MAG: hypothetical protein B7X50_12360 [Alishewanella sp. 34-51-39]|nr:MAG: hypothetical protein B7X50_12360 [Alishewanella sp. 34-51-39]
MAVSQTDIDALNAALKNGERVVKSDGVLVEYRSIAELISARNSLVAQMAAESSVARPRQTIIVHGGRGFRGA